MNAREKLEANEKRQDIFQKALYHCQVCHKSLYHYHTPQLAHRIPKTKTNLNKYGAEIINHEFNLVPVCSLPCNSLTNVGQSREKEKEIVNNIKKDLLS